MRNTNTCTITTTTQSSQVRKPKTTLTRKSCGSALQVIAFKFFFLAVLHFYFVTFSFFQKSLALCLKSERQTKKIAHKSRFNAFMSLQKDFISAFLTWRSTSSAICCACSPHSQQTQIATTWNSLKKLYANLQI